MHKPMVLFFPQYQAGVLPSNIPIGADSLRDLWSRAPGFVEVPLQPTDIHQPETDGGIHFRRVLKKQLEDAMAIVDAQKPDFILTTGGDCASSFVPIAYMNALYEGKIGVIWVDAHGDMHTPHTTPSGNYHGMVLRHLMGDIAFDIQPQRALTAGQVAFLGLRDTEIEEDEFIASQKIPRFGPEEVMTGNAPLDAVLKHFHANGVTHLHLHVDCDVMDESFFPHVEVPEPGGLSLNRLLEILQYLRAKMPMASCCLTEYAPKEKDAGIDIVKRIYSEGLGLTLPE
jgi:arginase